MAVGQNGRPVSNRAGDERPMAFAQRVGKHVHKGSPESTVGGPGCSTAPGANQQGSSGGGSPYGSGGDRS
jgi:hypothetical protein